MFFKVKISFYSKFNRNGRPKHQVHGFMRVYTAVKEPFFWAGVSDQRFAMTLDRNSALLIGSWQNTKLGVCK